jgi:hypothetical protein
MQKCPAWHGRIVATLGVAGALAACGSGGGTGQGERVAQVSAAQIGGTIDNSLDHPPYFPAVVGVCWRGHGCGTGTLLSDRVVVTAGHLATEVIRGCTGFVHEQDSIPDSFSVHVADENGCVYGSCGNPTQEQDLYWADAVYGRTQLVSANTYDCCGGSALGCDPCFVPAKPEYHNFNGAFDYLVLHLEKPVVGIDPLPFVAHVTSGWTSATARAYPIDILSWNAPWPLNNADRDQWLDGMAAGVGDQDGDTETEDGGWRKYGLLKIGGVGTRCPEQNNCLVPGPGKCAAYWGGDDPALVPFECERCELQAFLEDPNAVTPGYVLGASGDSGGPVIVNYTELGADPVAGLPYDDHGGKPFVVSFGLPVTWDAELADGTPTDTGTLLLRHLRDWDLDGVPDYLDNCPLAPNTDQANCNADAELDPDWGFKELGDACDPVPCPNGTLRPADLQDAGCLDHEFVTSCWGLSILDRIDVEPIGSHYISSGAQNHALLPELTVPDVPTHYSFCQPDATAGLDCVTHVIDKHLLGQEPQHPDPLKPWMAARMGPIGPGTAFGQEEFDYPATKAGRRWRYWADFHDWALGKISLGLGCNAQDGCCTPEYGCSTGLNGRFWIHAATTKGTHADPASDGQSFVGFAPPTTGYHPKAGTWSADDEQLSNHYLSIQPDGRYGWARGKPLIPNWPHSFLYNFIARLPRPPSDPVSVWDLAAGEKAYVLDLEGGGYGVLRRDGRAFVAEAELGVHLRERLAEQGLVWTDAVEPWLTASRTRADEGFRALVFAADGTDVVDGVLQQGAFAGTTEDFALGTPGRPGSPSPRDGFVPVFSRADDLAFVVGGRDQGSGAAAGDIWMRPVQAPGEWRRVDLSGIGVGQVLAATYCYADHRLWVLDEVEAAGKTKARLYRVEPYTGAILSVGDWPRKGHADRHWLLLDRDGQVLLVASSSTQGKMHAVARFEVKPAEPAAPLRFSFAVRGRSLALAPFADPAGYGIVLVGPHGTPLLERETDLHLVPSPQSKLATVM